MKTSNLIPVFLTVMLLTACASSGTATATPTAFDVKALQTSAVQTIIANITQTAAAQPTQAPTETLTPAPAAPTETSAPAVETVALTQEVSVTAVLTPAGLTPAVLTPGGSPTPQLCNDSHFVSDVSIQDGTVMTAGAAFVKTWRIKNIGTCTWTKAYQIIFGYGSNRKQLSGVTTKLPAEVPPGGEVEISVNMKAPAKTGNYSEYWQLADNNGLPFGQFFSVVISVP
jgi:hypothetical protein